MKKRKRWWHFFCPSYSKLTVNKNESSVCLKGSCLARNGTSILTHNKHEMIIWNAPKKQVDKNFYLAIHQVSLTGILKVFWTCSVNRLHFVVFECNRCRWMCLRPYPVYIKMWAKAKKIKVSVSCECAVHSFVGAQKNRAAVSGLLVWPKLEVWANKTITIN